MHSIQKVPFGNTVAYRLVNEKTGVYAEIVPSLGGILNAFVINTKKESFSIIDGFKDDQDFLVNNASTFKSNFLFPYPNRVRDGKYDFSENEYQLNLNFPQENNSIHGFVLDKSFKVIDTNEGENSCCISLGYQCDGEQGYPFPFLVMLEYRLSGNSLLLVTSIKNTGKSSLPYGTGWHHYFNLGDKLDALNLSFPSQKLLDVDSQMIPNGAERDYNDFQTSTLIAETALDTCFLVGNQGVVNVMLESPKKELRLTLEYDSSDYPYLQVYTPSH